LAGLGGVNALGVHGLRATTRVASTSVSFGALNPLLSLAGDAVALVALAGSFVAPVTTALAVFAITLVAITAGRRVARAVRRRAT
jgi:hypothetical protein